MLLFRYYLPGPLWAMRLWKLRATPAPVVGTPPEDRFCVVDVSGIEVPMELGVRRQGPSPDQKFDAGNRATFDATFLVYDVFERARDLVLIGPPPLNLRPVLASATLEIDGVRSRSRRRRLRRERVEMTYVRMRNDARRLVVRMGRSSVDVPVQPSRPDIFRGRKVLLVKSKDNDLAWIHDWVDYHARTQGADAVLFYENGSSSYAPAEVLTCIRSVPSIGAAVVVDWPYSYGARGPGFRGNYSQFVLLEHARRRFLGDAAAVLHLDIDELAVTERGQTVFERVAATATGAMIFSGVWIDGVTDASPSSPIRHRDFRYVRRNDRVPPSKWAAVPRLIPGDAQLTEHGLAKGFHPDIVSDIRFRHFRRINTSWKYDRSKLASYDPEVHVEDRMWLEQMIRIGWRKPDGSL